LTGESEKVGLSLQPEKCCAYSANQNDAELFGQLVGCKVSTDGIVAAGCPIGKPSFVAEEAEKSAQKVVALVQKLNDTELPAQDKLLLLRKSLQVKLSHLARCAEYTHIRQALLMVEQAVLQSILQIVGREEIMLDTEQLQLPLRKGGLGLQCLTANDGLVAKPVFWQQRPSHKKRWPLLQSVYSPSTASQEFCCNRYGSRSAMHACAKESARALSMRLSAWLKHWMQAP
jgi:hypothetical protein